MLKNKILLSIFVGMALTNHLYVADSAYAMEEPTGSYEKTNVPIKYEKLGPEEWKDQNGSYAPPQFRQAADRLWDAVRDEDSMRYNAGWVKERKQTYEETWENSDGCQKCTRVFCCPFACGISECIFLCGSQRTRDFEGEFEYNKNHRWGKQSRYDAQLDVKVTFTNRYMEDFKNVLNKSVKNPVNYSGDMNIYVDSTYHEYPDWSERKTIIAKGERYFIGGRRNLYSLKIDTLNFVNAHGGWRNEEDYSIFTTKMEGNKMIIDLKDNI